MSMSGECDKCGEHCLDCKCSLVDKLQTFSRLKENGQQSSIRLLNPKVIPLFEGIDPPSHIPERRTIDVKGRVEHEAVIKDSNKCKELGLDQVYEVMVYLNRWGGWLDAPENPA